MRVNNLQLSSKSHVHYITWGAGKKTVIAFHRYGGDSSLFEYLATTLRDQYTFIGIDLPYHGKTEWHEDSYNVKDLNDIVQKVLTTENRDRIDILIGHSMGGRLAAILFQETALPIEHLLLLTPEGLTLLPWYVLLKIVHPIRKNIVSFFHKRPHSILKLTQWLVALKLSPKSAIEFIRINIEKPHRMKRVTGTWLSYSNFKLDWNKMNHLIESKNKKGTILLASKDQVLPYKKLHSAAKKMSHFKEVTLSEQHFLCNSPRLATWMKSEFI